MLITMAAIQSATLRDKFGFAVEQEFAQTVLDNPVKFETEVPAGNIPLVCAPWISIGKNFDVEKPAYCAVSLGISKTDNSEHINLKLTNIKPEKDVTSKEIAALFTTKWNASNAEAVKAAALKAVAALK